MFPPSIRVPDLVVLTIQVSMFHLIIITG